MKIILLKDIHKIGRKYDVVDVTDGYAINNLIPKKQAEFATTANVAKYTKLKALDIENKAKKEEEVLANLDSIVSKAYEVKAKANASGHLFASVHKEDIAEIMGISSEYITLEKSIKEVGEYDVVINIRDISKSVKVNVVTI